MKKVFLLISSLILLSAGNSCSEDDLQLLSPTSDLLDTIDSEDKLQKFLNGAYLSLGSVDAFGTNVIVVGDVLSDHLYVSTASAAAFSNTYNMNYNPVTNDFGMYDPLYNAINNCNMVINNTKVESIPTNTVENIQNIARIKAEARIARALAYFTLVNYYSPSPTSGVNQDYGVPIVLENYDSTIKRPRATVAEVYTQIISDLTAALVDAEETPIDPDGAVTKTRFSKTAAKLILSRVYLTRRAAGDAQLALQYASEIVNNPGDFAPIVSTVAAYQAYFSGQPEANAENQPETIWELDVNDLSNGVTGLGANLALPTLYYRLSDRRALLFTKDFYDSFPHSANGATSTDIRRGSATAGLLTTSGVVGTGQVPGAWTNKYPRLSGDGNFQRNIKVFRFAEAQLNRIEALYLTGQTAAALTALNTFAVSRGGSTYTGTDLLNDILTEKGKEFYGEGQRFLDLKRWNLPIIKNSNCTTNCNLPANSSLFVLPINQSAINANPNLLQYPGY